ncbi:hypothetical protein MTE01_30230 [Microbacterium testaceum]|uniref:Uncharacterized protein n=1 Tax=Microbacterium testaceum TaxID=2033 RepID=A0A4Y3QRN7_MICTE|nr:hypothetical protein MTE01_30230 [Microbacterium testaceum]
MGLNPHRAVSAQLHGRAIGDDLLEVLRHLAGVEAHRDHRVGPDGLGRLDETLLRFVAALLQLLRETLQLAAEDRFQAGAELHPDVASAHGEAGHFAVHFDDLTAGDIVHGRDEHATSVAGDGLCREG